MVKRTLLTLIQFLAFCGLLFVGGNWDAIRLGQEVRALETHTTFWNPLPALRYPLGSHILIANGLLFATVLLVLLLLVQLFRRNLRSSAPYTLLAYVAAVIVCFVSKIGLPPAS